MITVNINVTAIFMSIVQLRMFGGIPRNNVAKILANTNIRNPRLMYTYARYFAAYSRSGPSITSAFVLSIAKGYSFKSIINPMKKTIAPRIPAKENKIGP